MTQPCDLLDVPPCGQYATHKAKNAEHTLMVCFSHADFLSRGGYLVTALAAGATCRYADGEHGPCGGPTNGIYCWDHKDLRHGDQP